jgi:hypothetical protein
LQVHLDIIKLEEIEIQKALHDNTEHIAKAITIKEANILILK